MSEEVICFIEARMCLTTIPLGQLFPFLEEGMAGDISLALAGAAVSAAVGYGLALWRNRIRPHVEIHDIGESHYGQRIVTVPPELESLVRQALISKPIGKGAESAVNVNANRIGASRILILNEDTMETLQATIDRLENPISPEDTLRAIAELLEGRGISDLLETAIITDRITVRPSAGSASVESDSISVVKEAEGGCFGLQFPGRNPILFGSGFDKYPGSMPKLRRAAELFLGANTVELLVFFKDLQPLLTQQLANYSTIKSLADRIIGDISMWSCQFSVTNLGRQPFVIFPSPVSMELLGRTIRGAPVEGRLTRIDDTIGKVRQVDHPIVLPAGQSLLLGFITKNMQSEIADTETIRGAYKDGTSKMRISMRIMGGENPWSRIVRSRPSRFRNTAAMESSEETPALEHRQ